MFKAMGSGIISLAIIFQVTLVPAPAEAISCSVAGGQSGRLKYSGQVTPVSATVCGNQIWKLIGKPKKPTKPVKPGKPRNYNNNFTVVPDKPKISGALNLPVGASGSYSAIANRHTKNRLLFWYPSQVRFTPQTYSWNFGDGQTANGQLLQHGWNSKGTYQVRLSVGYSVRYRIIGHSKWVPLTGLVYGISPPITVNVGLAPSSSSGNVSLVHWNCIQKPNAVGC
jgi:hypothetical protein